MLIYIYYFEVFDTWYWYKTDVFWDKENGIVYIASSSWIVFAFCYYFRYTIV